MAAIVQALMNDPDLIVMDEPMNGLDPLVQQTFMDMLHERAAAGTTVFMSSHVLSEVERACHRVAIIKHDGSSPKKRARACGRSRAAWCR